MVEDMEAASDHIDFSEKIWAKIQEDQAKYFPGQEITGWFFSRPQMYMETDELLTRIHLRYFGGEKVLMLMEPAEKEEAFFFFENGLMVRQRGYYIYYEKNPLMQECLTRRLYLFGKSSGTRKQRKQKRQRKSPRRKWSVPLFFHMQQRPVWYLLY